MQILLGKGWWQEPAGSSRRFPGVICRGTRRNRVSIVIHFRVCGVERGRETGFPFLSALEVFRRSQVPLLRLKYSLSSLGTIYIFTAFPSASFPLLMRFTLFGCPTTAIELYSVLEGVGWDDGEMSLYALIPTKAKRDVERRPRSTLNATGGRAGAFAALPAAYTWVILGRTICQVHHDTSWVKGPFFPAGHSRDDTRCSIPGVARCPWRGWRRGEGAVSANGGMHQPSPDMIGSPHQAGWVRGQRRPSPNPKEKVLKSQAAAVRGQGGIGGSEDGRCKNTSCRTHPGARVIVPTGKTHYGRS